ncbi:MAG: HdeA/HdeB family chaperone [Waterburya sp.]
MFIVITSKAANSSEEMDMSRLTCEQFLDMNTMEQVMSIVWYNGWVAKEQGTFMFQPDRDYLSEQKDSLTTGCEGNVNDLVVKQLPTIFSY